MVHAVSESTDEGEAVISADIESPEFLKAIKPHLHHILGVKLMDIVPNRTAKRAHIARA